MAVRDPEDYAVEFTLRALRGITFKSLTLILNQLSGQNRVGGVVTDKTMAKSNQSRDFIDFDRRLLDSRINEHIFKQELKRFGVQASILEMANGDTKLQFFAKDKEALIHALENVTDRIYQREPSLINKLFPDYEKERGDGTKNDKVVESEQKVSKTMDNQRKEITVEQTKQSFIQQVTTKAEEKNSPVRQEIQKAKEILQKEKAEKSQKEHKKEITGPTRESREGR